MKNNNENIRKYKNQILGFILCFSIIIATVVLYLSLAMRKNSLLVKFQNKPSFFIVFAAFGLFALLVSLFLLKYFSRKGNNKNNQQIISPLLISFIVFGFCTLSFNTIMYGEIKTNKNILKPVSNGYEADAEGQSVDLSEGVIQLSLTGSNISTVYALNDIKGKDDSFYYAFGDKESKKIIDVQCNGNVFTFKGKEKGIATIYIYNKTLKYGAMLTAVVVE